jgi:hypothetical protein
MNLYEYIARKTNYDPQTVLVTVDFINALIKRDLSYETRKEVLRSTFNTCTFSDSEIEAFANGKVPAEYGVVPVDVVVQRLYRIYVQVPKDSDSSMVKEAAKQQILDEGLNESDLSPEWDIERDDIISMDIDWEGVQEADE